MGENVHGLTVRDVLLEANPRLGSEKSFSLGRLSAVRLRQRRFDRGVV